MEKIICIDTGGTFNKIYNPANGKLEVDKRSSGAKKIFENWLGSFELISIIGKDSLDFTQDDRTLLVETIQNTPLEAKIVVIHGTDTMDISAQGIVDADLSKVVILTGAMSPFSIEPIEASANLASAIGFASSQKENGVYIAMNGLFGCYEKIKKDRKLARFIKIQ